MSTHEWSVDELRRWGTTALQALGDFVEGSRRGEGRPVKLRDIEVLVDELDLTRRLREGGLDHAGFTAFLDRFLAGATSLHHPGYMCHQVAVPHFAASIADLVSGVLNNGMSVYEMGPTASACERAVIQWMLGKVGWDDAAGSGGAGVLTHGGSLANLTALLAARARAFPQAWEQGTPPEAVVLAPPASHYSISRAVAIMGLGTAALQPLPVDRLGRLRPDEAAQAIERAVHEGRAVMAVCANACATATGLYDDLTAVGAACRAHDLWLHVDAAHGGSALVSPRERHHLAGLEHADSLVWDAHKLLQTSTLCAGVLTRRRGDLSAAFRQQASYVMDENQRIGVDVMEHQVECTKAPLGLKLALVLSVTGDAGMARHLETLVDLTRRAQGRIAARPGFEVLCDPESNILCFRHAGDDAHNSQLRQALLADGRFHLSQADVDGHRWLRITLMNPGTDEAVIDALLDTIETLAAGSSAAEA